MHYIKYCKFRRVTSYFYIDKPIEKITKIWLRKQKIKYDYLTIEKGSEDVYDPAAHIHNRFYASRITPIRFFADGLFNEDVKIGLYL